MYLNPLSKVMSFSRITDDIKPHPLSISKVVSLVVPFVNTHIQELKCKGDLHLFTLDTTQLTEQCREEESCLSLCRTKNKNIVAFLSPLGGVSNRTDFVTLAEW